MDPDPPLTAAQRAYLAVFDGYLGNPSPGNVQRRRIAMGLVLFEADVRLEDADPNRIEQSMERQGTRDIKG